MLSILKKTRVQQIFDFRNISRNRTYLLINTCVSAVAEVARSAAELEARGVSPVIFYDNGARATQTAELLGRELAVPRARLEPEFRWLEALRSF